MDEWFYIWAGVAALFIVLEIVTMAFVSIYIGLGALAAAIVAMLGGSPPMQFLAFAVAGIALMLATRPLLKKRLESPDIATNVNLLVGKGGIVTITIDNDANTGQIRVGTEYWTARMVDADATTVLPVDSRVIVDSVEGVTARVRLRSDAPSA
ncbi:MAG: NfeD family protein [Thermoleophilia bacterium]|nr:NfeD family protein [Thermoleophilia bacterium]